MNTIAQELESELHQIYDEMKADLKELCTSPDLNWYDFNDIDFFQMILGENYSSKENSGVIFYGRATNFWDLDCNEGINAIHNHKRSHFFSMVKKISQNLFGNDYLKNIGWSNIRKAIPRNTKNSLKHITDITKDFDFCSYSDSYNKRILRKEIEIASPKILVCITGTKHLLRYNSVLFEVFPDLKLVNEYDDGIEVYYNGRFFAIITERPERRDNETVKRMIDNVTNIIIMIISNQFLIT